MYSLTFRIRLTLP